MPRCYTNKPPYNKPQEQTGFQVNWRLRRRAKQAMNGWYSRVEHCHRLNTTLTDQGNLDQSLIRLKQALGGPRFVQWDLGIRKGLRELSQEKRFGAYHQAVMEALKGVVS